jgi:ATP-dependent DNA helicase UvrD/PcrA
VLKLTISHRSTQPILDSCNAVASASKLLAEKSLTSKEKNRGAKPYLTVVANERAQIRLLCERIDAARKRGIPLRDQAVLARTAEELDGLESQLRKLRIPYRKAGGSRLFERPDVKAIIAILGWSQNPRDTVTATQALEVTLSVPREQAIRTAASIRGRLQAPAESGCRGATTMLGRSLSEAEA